jgi:hypothetical protein
MKRIRVFVDFRLQTAFCIRVIIYWIIWELVFIGTVSGFQFLEGLPSEAGTVGLPSKFFLPATIVSACVLPIVLLDSPIFTNRFAGPLWRFKRNLRQLAEGKEVAEFKLRPGDYYQDLARDFDTFRRRVTQSSQVGRPDNADDSTPRLEKQAMESRSMATVQGSQ